MLRPDSASRRDMLTDHAIELIEEGGLAAVTFPAIARRLGLTRQGVTLWVGSRPELWQLVVGTFSQRWLQWTGGRASAHGALTFLPATAEEVRWTRVRLALEEQARISADLGPILSDLRLRERELLAAIHPELASTEAQGSEALLMLLLEGLRAAVCRADRPVEPQEARSIFWEECQRIAGDPADWLLPTAPWGPLSSDLLAGKQVREEPRPRRWRQGRHMPAD